MTHHNNDGVVRSMHKAVASRLEQPASVPVPIEKIVSEQKIRVIEEWDTPGRFEALSIFRDTQHYIVLNGRLSHAAQRFALAHELAHGWFHRPHLSGVHSGRDYAAHPYYPLFEREANIAAAAILLPHDWFITVAEQLLPSRPLTIREFKDFMASSVARDWARQAAVSNNVLGYHLIDLGYAPRVPTFRTPPAASESAPPNLP